VATSVGYPCLLKPTRSRDWAREEARSALGARKVIPAADLDALRAAFHLARGFAERHLVEEVIPGPGADNYYVVCYVDGGGALRARFVHRKILMRPPGRGVGCLIESVHREDLSSRVGEFLLTVGHVGIGGVELK
jgi:predicted ATP-grasp superfamily ATP-dependent carboligase